MSFPFDRQLQLLEHVAAKGPLPAWGRDETEDVQLTRELHEAGLLSCTNPHQIRGVDSDLYCGLSITVAGRQQIEIWKDEKYSRSPRGKVVGFLRQVTLWIGIGIGVAATKTIEWGVDRFLNGSE